jgi:hypothetical protein
MNEMKALEIGIDEQERVESMGILVRYVGDLALPSGLAQEFVVVKVADNRALPFTWILCRREGSKAVEESHDGCSAVKFKVLRCGVDFHQFFTIHGISLSRASRILSGCAGITVTGSREISSINMGNLSLAGSKMLVRIFCIATLLQRVI